MLIKSGVPPHDNKTNLEIQNLGRYSDPFCFMAWPSCIYKSLGGKTSKAESVCQQKILKLKDDQQKALIKKQNEINQVSADYEQLKSEQRIKVETVTREVQKIVERPIYKSICFDDSGVSAINSLITENSS